MLPLEAKFNEVDPHRFVLFPGCEFIKPKKPKVDSITEWVKAFAIFMAATWKQYPEAMPEMIAYLLLILNAGNQYDGLYWRAYDTTG